MTQYKKRPWHDDPIDSATMDTIGTQHVANRIARLVDENHSWKSSVVFGLTGPWGSGKTSLVGMTCEALLEQYPGWTVANFTPWATSDSAGLMSEFYSALAKSLPGGKADKVREKLSACARVAAPLLKVVPVVGTVLADGAKLAEEKLAEQPPWSTVFEECTTELRKLERPVLVVADDIDRLQRDELVSLLKIVRLLGRFPGVCYLLAYDEETLFSNLGGAELGVSGDRHARLFMEKIVQYPIAVPPIPPSEALARLESGLTSVLAALDRPVLEYDSRMSALVDVLESQLTTPRSIDRYLAQAHLFLSMHKPNEIDDTDLLLLTLIRTQFPDLYALLPRWRRSLTADPSMWQLAKQEVEVEWGKLFEIIKSEDDRADAREILEAVFPAMSKYSSGTHSQRGARNSSYFMRYFVHTIPAGDVADADVDTALMEAGADDAGHAAMDALLTSDYPGRADLALSKLIGATIPKHGYEVAYKASVPLLASLMSLVEQLEGGPSTLVRRQERAIGWAADLIRWLPPETSSSELIDALERCDDRSIRMHVVWRAMKEPAPTSPFFKDAAHAVAVGSIPDLMDNLRLGDDAPMEDSTSFYLSFITELASADLQDAIAGDLGKAFSLEDLAARCVNLSYLIGPNPIPQISSFDQVIFSHYAPQEDLLYGAEIDESLDTDDVSWANRRAYIRGRAKAPA